MRDDILNTHLRPLYQFRIEEDALLADLAVAPALFQALMDNLGLGDMVSTKARVDRFQQTGEPLIGTVAVPGGEGVKLVCDYFGYPSPLKTIQIHPLHLKCKPVKSFSLLMLYRKKTPAWLAC